MSSKIHSSHIIRRHILFNHFLEEKLYKSRRNSLIYQDYFFRCIANVANIAASLGAVGVFIYSLTYCNSGSTGWQQCQPEERYYLRSVTFLQEVASRLCGRGRNHIHRSLKTSRQLCMDHIYTYRVQVRRARKDANIRTGGMDSSATVKRPIAKGRAGITKGYSSHISKSKQRNIFRPPLLFKILHVCSINKSLRII